MSKKKIDIPAGPGKFFRELAIDKGNRAIALFMNCDIDEKGVLRFSEETYHDDILCTWCFISELRFHQSWDWLMPVVYFIGKLPSIGDINGIYSDVNKALLTHDIKETWLAVVKFLNWYEKAKRTG